MFAPLVFNYSSRSKLTITILAVRDHGDAISDYVCAGAGMAF